MAQAHVDDAVPVVHVAQVRAVIAVPAEFDSDNLHDQDAFFQKLNDTLTFDYHTQCNVCNTDVFHSESGQQINYHKGIFTTSILDEEENTLEINDFVINMFGDLYIDWIFEEQYALTSDIIRSIFEKY